MTAIFISNIFYRLEFKVPKTFYRPVKTKKLSYIYDLNDINCVIPVLFHIHVSGILILKCF